ncbi:MAG: Exodeoxyribonuclease 7 large subunit [Planctomycetota bacterium]
MPPPPFDPNRAKGDPFLGGLFDPTPVAKAKPPAPPPVGGRPTPAAGGGGSARSAEAAPPPQTDAPAPPARAPSKPAELSVTDFSDLISRTLEEGMRGQFRVHGEIANLSKRNHWYFSIKDAKSVLSCVMWQSDVARTAHHPREGDAVVVTGRIAHYGPQGRTQLVASRVEPFGVGALELEFQRLVAELRALGYFDEDRKRPLPAMPRRIAVVTSAAGAALQDVLRTARERCPMVDFTVVDVRVQGAGAAEEVARALDALGRRHRALAIDAVVVTRGGGSREDLWAFNERIVAEAAYRLPIPLVAAIGHEVDTSVIELVADCRASTPTQAVMKLLPDLGEVRARLERTSRDLRNAMRWSIETRRRDLDTLADAPELASPELRIAGARERLAQLGRRLERATGDAIRAERRTLERLAPLVARANPAARLASARATLAATAPRLARAIAQRLATTRTRLEHASVRLSASGPERTLARGYAIVTGPDGRVAREAAAFAAGDLLAITLARGTVATRVESVRMPASPTDRPSDAARGKGG